MVLFSPESVPRFRVHVENPWTAKPYVPYIAVTNLQYGRTYRVTSHWIVLSLWGKTMYGLSVESPLSLTYPG